MPLPKPTDVVAMHSSTVVLPISSVILFLVLLKKFFLHLQVKQFIPSFPKLKPPSVFSSFLFPHF